MSELPGRPEMFPYNNAVSSRFCSFSARISPCSDASEIRASLAAFSAVSSRFNRLSSVCIYCVFSSLTAPLYSVFTSRRSAVYRETLSVRRCPHRPVYAAGSPSAAGAFLPPPGHFFRRPSVVIPWRPAVHEPAPAQQDMSAPVHGCRQAVTPATFPVRRTISGFICRPLSSKATSRLARDR